MKMIGMSARSSAMWFCRSSPLRSGRFTSSTKQVGTTGRGCERKSRAEAKVTGSQPSKRTSISSDSRTDMSSSTTNTIGVASGTVETLNGCAIFPYRRYVAAKCQRSQAARRAVLIAASRAAGSKGLNRQATAPWESRRGRAASLA